MILASLAAALFWGAAHALSPGHGKTIVDRVPRRPPRHAAARGAARPDRDRHAHDRRLRARPRDARAVAVHRPRPALPVAEPRRRACSSSRIGAVGAARRSRVRAHSTATHHHHHDHERRAGTSFRALLAVGVSGGAAAVPVGARRAARGDLAAPRRVRPAPDRRVRAGLALTITGIGLVAVLARSGVRARESFDGRLVRALPAASAVVILAAGLAMTAPRRPESELTMFGLDTCDRQLSDGADARARLPRRRSSSASVTRPTRTTSRR